MAELRLQENWTERFARVDPNNMGWDANTPVGTGAWYGAVSGKRCHRTEHVEVIPPGPRAAVGR